MNHYELVVVLDPKLTKQDHTQTVSALEELLGSSVKDKDDMGLLDLAHTLLKLKSNTQAYFLSYQVQIDSTHMDTIKKKIIFIKGIVKYVFLKMKPTDTFFKFKDLQEKFKEEPKEPKPARFSRPERTEKAPKVEEVATETVESTQE